MSKFVTITAGHSLTDPGAIGFGQKESDIARDMRNMVKFYLNRDGIQTKTDGEGVDNKPLSHAITLINGSSIAIEFHCNAFSNPSAKGVEALAQPKDKLISAKLCLAVADVLGTVVRGSDSGWKNEGSGQHSRLGYVRNGGIILELFFITNRKELDSWNAKKWLVAKAVAQVIKGYVK